MSYSLRNYRHRNPQKGEEQKAATPFFNAPKGAAVQKKKEGAFFQPKLTVGQPGDIHEKEADAVASQVVQRLATSKEDEKLGTNDARMEKDKEDPLKPVQKKEGGDDKKEKKDIHKAEDPKKKKKGVHKAEDPKKEKKDIHKAEDPKKEKKDVHKAEDPKKEKKDIHKAEDPEKKKKKGAGQIQKKPETTASDRVSAEIERQSGKGSPLPAKVLAEMNHSFNMDFSKVRIHHDAAAAKLCLELHAQAFTHGHDIYFNEGKYNPESPEGKLLLAHELTHVAQQKNSDSSPSK
jgi:Domain of unknown function (DUF4157)